MEVRGWRLVYKAVAKHLTYVTLELGGKSPTVTVSKARDYTP